MPDTNEYIIAQVLSITRCQREEAIRYLELSQWKVDAAVDMFFEHRNGNSRRRIRLPDDDNDGGDEIRPLYRASINIQGSCQKYQEKPRARAFDIVQVSPRSSFDPAQTTISPTMNHFTQFLTSANQTKSTCLIEYATKMANLAMKYALRKEPKNVSLCQIEHWHKHIQIDYKRLQMLLDSDMCAPLIWIEHFEHLLNGEIDQLFDCDYMFHINENDEKMRIATRHLD